MIELHADSVSVFCVIKLRLYTENKQTIGISPEERKIKSEISLTSQIFFLDGNEVTLRSNGDSSFLNMSPENSRVSLKF